MQKKGFLAIGGRWFELLSEMHLKALLLRQKQSCRDLWILQSCAATYITIKHIDQSSDWSAGAYAKETGGQRLGPFTAHQVTPPRLCHQTALINLACVRLCKQSQVRPRHPKHWLFWNEGRGIASAGSLLAGREAGKEPQPDGNMWPNYRAARQ